MCFSIPLKVVKIQKTHAILENGIKIRIDTQNIQQGDYVRIVGNMIVDKLSKKDGEAIRKLIADLSGYHGTQRNT
ncbi:MAG: HypC/HybG/HupF family hydrogenase formation chaperone [Patescibacteria group bacterium]|nr:HypC/HybG/HupF family hydrogenase formation chaperone [Patescibacteria group bacterium]